MKVFKYAIIILWYCCIPKFTDVTMGSILKYSFAKGEWDPNDWVLVKSPRWDRLGNWIQKDLYIENCTPSDANSADLLNTRASETYTSMVLKKQFSGKLIISSTMEFTDQMAPLIVITSELSKDKKGRTEFRDYFEIVISDKGINVWHHYFKDNQLYCKKIAYDNFMLKSWIKYNVKVKITPMQQGKIISISMGDDHEFGFNFDSLPDKYFVGITGCEGINHFYNFILQNDEK